MFDKVMKEKLVDAHSTYRDFNPDIKTYYYTFVLHNGKMIKTKQDFHYLGDDESWYRYDNILVHRKLGLFGVLNTRYYVEILGKSTHRTISHIGRF